MSESDTVVTRRQELADIVAYSFFLHRLAYRWYSRIDKLIAFLLLLSAMAVVSSLLPPLLLGFSVSFLTAWQLVYTPGEQAAAAKVSMTEYGNLLNHFSTLSDAELEAAVSRLSPADSDPPACLHNPAQLAAYIKLNVDSADLPKLTRGEKLASCFCG